MAVPIRLSCESIKKACSSTVGIYVRVHVHTVRACSNSTYTIYVIVRTVIVRTHVTIRNGVAANHAAKHADAGNFARGEEAWLSYYAVSRFCID